MIRKLMVVTFAGAMLAGCSSGGKSNPGGCDLGGDVCIVGTGVTSQACSTNGGTWEASGCPTAARVGTCKVSETGATYTYSLYSPTYDATSAAADCAAMGGTFSTGSSGGTTTNAVACLWATDQCWQLTGTLSAADKSTIAGQCAQMGATYVAGPCSTTATIAGSCYYANTGLSGVHENDFYYTATWNDAGAKADCSSFGGTWTLTAP